MHRKIRVNGEFNLIVLQTATLALTGRTVKKTADIASTINRVMLRMDAVAAAVTLGMRLAFVKHTYVSKMKLLINKHNALVILRKYTFINQSSKYITYIYSFVSSQKWMSKV